jgi:hypothetical protein
MSLFLTLAKYFMYSHLPYFLYSALLLRRRGVLWWWLLLGVRNPRSSACGKMVSFPLLSPSWTCNKFFFVNKIRCNKHWLCCLFHYLSLYVWNLILAHIKECIQFWPKHWVWHGCQWCVRFSIRRLISCPRVHALQRLTSNLMVW